MTAGDETARASMDAAIATQALARGDTEAARLAIEEAQAALTRAVLLHERPAAHAMKPHTPNRGDTIPRLHCPTLVGPTDRFWHALLAEAKAAGVDVNAGEAALWLTHDQADELPSSSGASG